MTSSRTQWWHSVLLWSLIALLGLFLIYPIWLTVRGGFYVNVAAAEGFTAAHILSIFQSPIYREGLTNAFFIACGTTGLSILIALPLAFLTANYKFMGKAGLNALILIPLILPPFVGAIGMRAILGRFGALNTLLGTEIDFLGNPTWKFWGIIIVEALHLYPIIYLNATAALANLDPALDEAAINVGAGPWARFWRVILPLIRPGLFAGSTIVFIWSFTELGTPLMFDFYAVTPVQIFNEITEIGSRAEPYALTAVMLVSSVLLYAIGKSLFGGRGHAMYSKAARASEEKRLTGPMAVIAPLGFAAVIFLAVLPHLGVVLSAIAADGAWYRTVLPERFTLGHFSEALGSPMAFGSIVNSLIYSLLAVVINVFVALIAGYLIVRTRAKGRALLDALAMLPLAVPGLVLAFGFVAMSIQLSGVFPFREGDPLNLSIIGAMPNPIILLVVAYAVRRLPYVLRATVAGLEQTSGELEEAAVNLGASTITAVRRIIVPLIMANLIAGALLAFSFAMLEVSDSLILAQREIHYPVTKAIYVFYQRLGAGEAIASAMGVWGMALLTVTLVGASVMLGKKLGAIFRV